MVINYLGYSHYEKDPDNLPPAGYEKYEAPANRINWWGKWIPVYACPTDPITVLYGGTTYAMPKGVSTTFGVDCW